MSITAVIANVIINGENRTKLHIPEAGGNIMLAIKLRYMAINYENRTSITCTKSKGNSMQRVCPGNAVSMHKTSSKRYNDDNDDDDTQHGQIDVRNLWWQ